MTDSSDLVPAFSTDLEPTEAAADRVCDELDAFASQHGVADHVRERLARVTADVLGRLTELRASSEPIVVEADIDQGNVQVVFSRELESREAVAAARAVLLSAAMRCDAFSVQSAGAGSTIEVWICLTLSVNADAGLSTD